MALFYEEKSHMKRRQDVDLLVRTSKGNEFVIVAHNSGYMLLC